MCMDVFAPGCCIDTKLFFEQIWIKKSKNAPHEVGITEINDLCVQNCKGSPPLKELWLLFPNDYTQKDGQRRKATIEVLPMSPAVCEEGSDYEWAYDGPPERTNSGDYVVRNFFTEPPSLGGRAHVSLRGKLLVSKDSSVRFHPDLKLEHLEVLASRDIRKTLVCVTLKEPIQEGEQGWLRVIARPQRLDAIELKVKEFPRMPGLMANDYRLVIQCPIIVRQMLDIRLDNPHLTKDRNIHTQCEHIRNVILTNGAYLEGTSTRITDHRIALIATDDYDVCDTTCAGSMTCLGRVPPLEESGHTAILWHGGSNSNLHSDLLHNAKRVVDMVHHAGSKTKEELALALSPSGKHEAFSVLIDKMVDANLLAHAEENSAKLVLPKGLGKDETWDEARMTNLRKVYSARSPDEQVGLLQEFTDLHPFRIDFRLKWFYDKQS